MKFSRRRAVSPIIASLLLIAIAVAAGIIVYVYVNSLAGGLTQGGGQQVASQIQMQAANFLPQTFAAGKTSNGQVLDVFLENTGSSSVSISSVYFDGNQLTEWAYSSGTSYETNLYVPHSGQSCFALVPSTVSLTYSQTPVTAISGTSTTCTGNAGTTCDTVLATDFCVVSSVATPAETGMTASPLAAQGTAQLVIGLNLGAAVTSGSTHTIKLVTTSGTVAVFSVVAGRTS
jgi:flagellin-like protein